MKKLLLTFLVMLFYSGLYAFTPTPTITPTAVNTPVYVAVNALGTYSNGTSQACIITLTAQEYIDKHVAAVQDVHLIQIPTSAGWIIAFIGTPANITNAQSNYWYMTAVQRSAVLTKFPVLTNIENCIKYELQANP